jgi:hypothetical protein
MWIRKGDEPCQYILDSISPRKPPEMTAKTTKVRGQYRTRDASKYEICLL